MKLGAYREFAMNKVAIGRRRIFDKSHAGRADDPRAHKS